MSSGGYQGSQSALEPAKKMERLGVSEKEMEGVDFYWKYWNRITSYPISFDDDVGKSLSSMLLFCPS